MVDRSKVFAWLFTYCLGGRAWKTLCRKLLFEPYKLCQQLVKIIIRNLWLPLLVVKPIMIMYEQRQTFYFSSGF